MAMSKRPLKPRRDSKAPTKRPEPSDSRVLELERDLARERRERERDEAALGEMVARVAEAEREKNKALAREAKAAADAADRLLEATQEIEAAERLAHASAEKLRATEDRMRALADEVATLRASAATSRDQRAERADAREARGLGWERDPALPVAREGAYKPPPAEREIADYTAQMSAQRDSFERALAAANARLREALDMLDAERARGDEQSEAARERDRLAFELGELREAMARAAHDHGEALKGAHHAREKLERQSIELAAELAAQSAEREVYERRCAEALEEKEIIEEENRSLDAALSLERELRASLEAHAASLERELARLRVALIEADRDASLRSVAAVSAAQQIATLSAREAELAALREEALEQVRAVLAMAPMRVAPPQEIPKRQITEEPDEVIEIDDEPLRNS